MIQKEQETATQPSCPQHPGPILPFFRYIKGKAYTETELLSKEIQRWRLFLSGKVRDSVKFHLRVPAESAASSCMELVNPYSTRDHLPYVGKFCLFTPLKNV